MADRMMYSNSPRSTFGSRGALAASAMVETHGGEGLEWFVLGANGEELGPFNFRVVRAKLRIGVFQSDSYVWREGMDDWGMAKDQYLFANCINYVPMGGNAEAGTNLYQNSLPTNGTMKASSVDVDSEDVRKELRFSTGIKASKSKLDEKNSVVTGDEWFYINKDRSEEGPCTKDELQILFDNGDIDGASWVWNYRKQPEWAMIMNCSQLKSLFISKDGNTEEHKTDKTDRKRTVRREFMTRQELEDDDSDSDIERDNPDSSLGYQDSRQPAQGPTETRTNGEISEKGTNIPARFKNLPAAVFASNQKQSNDQMNRITKSEAEIRGRMPPPPPQGR